MSAGTGIQHSEFNASREKDINLLQIWLFPKVKNVTPRYAQRSFLPQDRVNQLQIVVAPIGSDEEKTEAIGIHQDAWFSLGTLEKDIEKTYSVKKTGNGVYAFVIEGDVTVNGHPLSKRDALGILDIEKLTIKAESNAEILLMDVPMSIGN